MSVEIFERWVEEHYPMAYRFALSLCGRPEDASDLTQDAFVIAHKKFDQVRDPSKRKAWLFTVLRREFLHQRQRQRDHQPLEFVESELPLITVDHAAKIDSKAAMEALAGMEEHYRVPLSMFYFERASYKEIAAALNVPIGTVMSRMARGKEILRQRLEKSRTDAIGRIVPLAGEGHE